MAVPHDKAIHLLSKQVPDTRCPLCGAKGLKVKPITIASLLIKEARALASSMSGFRFCSTPSCDIAYFHYSNGERFHRRDVRVRIGLKEKESPQLVCYCFNYSVEDIEAELAARGTSRIPDEIADKCRLGLDRCAERNPKGACCLGDVSRVLQEAQHKTTLDQTGGELTP